MKTESKQKRKGLIGFVLSGIPTGLGWRVHSIGFCWEDGDVTLTSNMLTLVPVSSALRFFTVFISLCFASPPPLLLHYVWTGRLQSVSSHSCLRFLFPSFNSVYFRCFNLLRNMWLTLKKPRVNLLNSIVRRNEMAYDVR